MKKLLAPVLLLVAGVPPLLSLIAGQYLETVLTNNRHEAIRILRFDYHHGWFNSVAVIDLEHKSANLVIRTQHRIEHGPVIWSALLSHPLKAFSLYQADSRFEIFDTTDLNSSGLDPASLEKGTAITSMSYTGNFRTDIHYPGLVLRLPGSQLFADLIRLSGEFSAQGDLLGKLSTNQMELEDRYGTIYLTQPVIASSMDADMPLPEEITASVTRVNGRLGADEFNTGALMLTSELEKGQRGFELSSNANTDRLSINQAIMADAAISLQVVDINEDTVSYISENYTEIATALQDNQWLALLSHLAPLIEQIGDHQPHLELHAQAIHDGQPVSIRLFGKFDRQGNSRLNPFSIIDDLEIEINAIMPVKLVEEINRTDLTNFLDLMADNGLLTRSDETYHSNLSFADTKLKIIHEMP